MVFARSPLIEICQNLVLRPDCRFLGRHHYNAHHRDMADPRASGKKSNVVLRFRVGDEHSYQLRHNPTRYREPQSVPHRMALCKTFVYHRCHRHDPVACVKPCIKRAFDTYFAHILHSNHNDSIGIGFTVHCTAITLEEINNQIIRQLFHCYWVLHSLRCLPMDLCG